MKAFIWFICLFTALGMLALVFVYAHRPPAAILAMLFALGFFGLCAQVEKIKL